MHYLTFDLSEGAEGVQTLEAMAATSAAHHAAVMAEVQQLLDWAWREFPRTHGPADEGMDWDHDLQVSAEAGGWHSVALTVTGSQAFFKEFFEAFGDVLE